MPAYVFADKDLQENLASLSSITNIGCSIVLTSTAIDITLNDERVYHGYKRPHDTLWIIDLDKLQAGFIDRPHTANVAIQLDLDADFVAFMHATLGSPPTSSFLKAARKGWLNRIPRLTANMIAANPPNSVATAMGHLDQTRQVKRPRKRAQGQARHQLSSPQPMPTSEPTTDPTTGDPNYDDPIDEDPLTDVHTKIVLLSDLSNVAHVDATGRFPVKSRKGNEYVLVSVWDGYVHFEAMSSRSSASYVQAYTRMLAFYKSVGRTPRFWRLDNETSAELEKFLADNGSSVQLVPPGTYRANKAEIAIKHAKNHIQSMFATTDPAFPLDLWDELLPQGEITINHFRPYTPDPTLCAYEGFIGHTYDFVAHPLSICGMSVLVHDKPDERPSWAPHGSKGYYLGPALKHHKCWRTFIVDTQKCRNTDSVAWFPRPYKLPGSDPHSMVKAAIDDLAIAMRLLAMSDIISPSTRHLILDHTAVATSELRAVVDMYSPSLSSHDTDPDDSRLVADLGAQRVVLQPT